MSQKLTLDMPEPELVMWDGAGGTAYILARGMYSMTPRVKAITRALLLLALEEIDMEEA